MNNSIRRKSPIEHTVHKHLREGQPIKQYHRGHGKPPKETLRLGSSRPSPISNPAYKPKTPTSHPTTPIKKEISIKIEYEQGSTQFRAGGDIFNTFPNAVRRATARPVRIILERVNK